MTKLVCITKVDAPKIISMQKSLLHFLLINWVQYCRCFLLFHLWHGTLKASTTVWRYQSHLQIPSIFSKGTQNTTWSCWAWKLWGTAFTHFISQNKHNIYIMSSSQNGGPPTTLMIRRERLHVGFLLPISQFFGNTVSRWSTSSPSCIHTVNVCMFWMRPCLLIVSSTPGTSSFQLLPWCTESE